MRGHLTVKVDRLDARVLLTGRPGSGKTTVVMKVARELQQRDVPLTGFLTEEVRESGAAVSIWPDSTAAGKPWPARDWRQSKKWDATACTWPQSMRPASE